MTGGGRGRNEKAQIEEYGKDEEREKRKSKEKEGEREERGKDMRKKEESRGKKKRKRYGEKKRKEMVRKKKSTEKLKRRYNLQFTTQSTYICRIQSCVWIGLASYRIIPLRFTVNKSGRYVNKIRKIWF